MCITFYEIYVLVYRVVPLNCIRIVCLGTSPAGLSLGPTSAGTSETNQQQEAQAGLVLRIFATSQKDIDTVVDRIEDFCKSETKDMLLDDPEQQAIIENLSEQQVTVYY